MLQQFKNWNPECSLAQMAKVQDRILYSGGNRFDYEGHNYSIEFGSTDHRRLSIRQDHELLGAIYLNDGQMDIYTGSILLRKKLETFILRYNRDKEMQKAHAESMMVKQEKRIANELERKEQMKQAIENILKH